MSNQRYLTKSRFKLATECPTKLFYTGKKEYPDQSMEDSFLAALAEGGFQVGELAKAYHPDGHDIESLDYKTAIEQTNALLERENVTIFEAAIRHENLFIRIDVLRKRKLSTFSLDSPIQTGEGELRRDYGNDSFSPEKLVIYREHTGLILQAIESLPPSYKTVINLRHREDKSYEEIARTLECSLSAAKSLIHRARQTLKRRLRPYLRSEEWRPAGQGGS